MKKYPCTMVRWWAMVLFAVVAWLPEQMSYTIIANCGDDISGESFIKDEEAAMSDKKTPAKAPSFKTIPVGTAVTWHYRSAIGHGTVTGIHKHGTTADNTMYSIEQHDHHPGEPAVVHHSGKALTRAAT